MDQFTSPQVNPGTEAEPANKFIICLFGASEHPVFICSLANDRDDSSEPTERHVATRDTDEVTAFISKWDRPKRGAFFCVSTIRSGMNRNKENVAEICVLHSDIDFKDVVDDADTILRRLGQLPLPPSAIVNSGHGLHVYWRLKEALVINIVDGVETIERVEAALKLLADLCGGDMRVTEVARLMRLPQTHNSKNGEWLPVEVIEQHDSRAYELDDLEEVLATVSPIVLRKVRPQQQADSESNSYLQIAERFGFKPPIDVEERLAAMTYMGGETASIHGTQLAVTASLLNAGRDVDEVVGLVLEATRAAAGDYAKHWNWRREERAVRGMCETWVKKHPPNVQPQTAQSATATVHDLGEARAKKKEKTAEPKPKSQAVIDRENLHILVGQSVLEMLNRTGCPVLVVVDQLWRYDKAAGLWSEAARSALDVDIERCICALPGKTSNMKLVSEVRAWFWRRPEIHRDTMTWDDHGKIAIRGGLIDPKTLAFELAKPEHHVTAYVDCPYRPGAECPVWLEMLDTTFADKTEEERVATIGLMQEWLGMSLIEDKSKALSRALIFHGASNTGKTDLIKTMSGLLTDRPISTPLGALDGTHGLMEFKRKAPWVLHEAFNGGKWHFSDIVKSILSGDPVQINVKNAAIVTKRIRQPVLWATNFPPAFKEATKAIVNRLTVIETAVVFDPENPVGVALQAKQQGFSEPSEMILASERPGLLNWALAGLQRALARGWFVLTADMKATLETIRRDSNLVAAFLEECVDYGPGYMISTSDFCAAFAAHWAENKGEDRNVPSNDSIGRALVALADPCIGLDREVLRDERRHYYAGIHLNEAGLEYWAAAVGDGLVRGKTARTSRHLTDLERLIPAAWDSLPVVRKMRKHQKNPPPAKPKTETKF
jgi:hypothetical protein